MLNIYKKVLVVAAHPDDETLGCGGFLAKLASAGAHITLLLLGEGPVARQERKGHGDPAAVARVSVRQAAHASALGAARILGITDVLFADLPDNRFDTLPLLELIQTIEHAVGALRPDLILTHFSGDLNKDHRLTHQAVLTAFRPLPGQGPTTIASFEVLSSTEYASPQCGHYFHPNLFVDITGTLAQKQEALAAYGSELRPWPHPRSPEAVAHLAGMRGSQCGRRAAEAFFLCRMMM